MHELSIALSILDIAEEEADRQPGARVAAIRLRLGPLSGVGKDALQSAFELVRESSPMNSAELIVDEVPLETFCPACATKRFPISTRALICPVCGSPTPQVLRGQELEVAALEIEK